MGRKRVVRRAPKQAERTNIAIITVHPDKCSWGYHKSTLLTLLRNPHHRYYFLEAESGVNVAEPRNMLVREFLEECDAEYALWIDADIEWEPDIIDRLMGHDLPIVSALYMGHRKTTGDLFPVYTVAYSDRPGGHRADPEDVPEGGGLIEVFGVGMGFCLIKREVHEALGYRLFWPFAETDLNDQQTGEDSTFCIRARDLGYKSYVDLDVRVGHQKSITI